VKKAFAARAFLGVLIVCSCVVLALAKEDSGKTVDSGSFGLFQNGRRMATETFSIEQSSDDSTITSEIKPAGSNDPTQASVLQIAPDGGLLHYEWHELVEPKAQLTVVPNNEFLLERITPGANAKTSEHPYLMPRTSVILDDNFTVQREVLAWRYLASNCTQQKNGLKCAVSPFGTVVPQEQLSARVTVEPAGEETLSIHGVMRKLWRLNLKSEDQEWSLWLDPDDHFKLIRMTRAGVNMEIVRD
jgi:hypothetical protein